MIRQETIAFPSPAGYTPANAQRALTGVPSMSEVTQILNAIEHGDPHAAEQRLPLVDDELRKLAAHKLAQENQGHTVLDDTVAHEAYLRLVGGEIATRWDSRGHYFIA